MDLLGRCVRCFGFSNAIKNIKEKLKELELEGLQIQIKEALIRLNREIDNRDLSNLQGVRSITSYNNLENDY